MNFLFYGLTYRPGSFFRVSGHHLDSNAAVHQGRYRLADSLPGRVANTHETHKNEVLERRPTGQTEHCMNEKRSINYTGDIRLMVRNNQTIIKLKKNI